MALLAIVWCPAQNLQIAFRYDENHVLFYAATRYDPATFSMADIEELKEKGPVADYGSGGYFLPLTENRLRTFKDWPASEEESCDIPPLQSTFTVFLGGSDKIRVTAERYIEQWGMGNPVIRVGVIARIAPNESRIFHKAQTSAFLISKKGQVSLPTAITQKSVCTDCKRTSLNRFLPAGELILEQWDAGWTVTLYRRTANGIRGTKVSYGYAD